MHRQHCHFRFANVLILALTTSLLPLLPATAQSTAPDFGPGFQHFLRLGLPDITKAEYVHLEREGSRYSGHGMHSGQPAIPARNGAWVIKPINEDEVELITIDQQRLTVVSPKKWKAEWEKKMAEAQNAAMNGDTAMNMTFYRSSAQGYDTRVSGTWKAADPIEDGRALIAYIEKLESNADKQDDEWFGGGSYSQNPLKQQAGELLLTAANLHSRGALAEANRLAQLLFEKAGGQKPVIEQAVSLLADTQYTDLYRTFIETRDWEAYLSGMTELTSRFTRGWNRRDAILRVIPTVNSRLSGPAPVPEADGLGKTCLTMAATLAAPQDSDSSKAPSLRQYDENLWVLTVPERASTTTNQSPDAITRIRERGLKSIPLLVALLEDTYPTEYDNPSGSIPMRNDHYSQRSSGPLPPQVAAKMAKQRANAYYASLPRPLTRGEIAEALLRQVIPLSDEFRYQRSDQSPADARLALKVAAESWYAEAKDKKLTDIAFDYLQRDNDNGYSAQRRAALLYLVDYGDEPAFVEVERVLLSMDPMQANDMAMVYADKRGEEARPFITNFIARLKSPEKPKPQDENALFVQRSVGSDNKEWRLRVVKQFEALLTNESLADLLVSIRNGEGDFRNQYQMLYKAAKKETPTQATEQLLNAALDAPDAKMTSQMVNMVASLPYAWMTSSRGIREGTPPAKPEMPKPSVHADLWRKLLEDKRPVSTDMKRSGVSTIGDQTAWVLESFNDDTTASMYSRGNAQLYAMLPTEQMSPLLHQRAKLRIEGESDDALPSLPNADNVEPEALEALITELIATPPDALAKRIATLSLDEHFAMIKKTADSPELREALRPLANQISQIEIEIEDQAIKSNIQKLANQPISKAIVEQLFNAVQSIATNSQISVTATLIRQAPSDGISLALRSADQEGGASMLAMYSYSMPGKQKPMITGTYTSGRANGFGRWKVELPKPPVKEEPTPDNNRTKQLMELLRAGPENLTPEVLKELQSLSEADMEEMEEALDDMGVDDDTDYFGGNNDQFWKAIETIDKTDTYTSPLFLFFTYTQPEEDEKSEDGEDGADDWQGGIFFN